jgi:Cu+-exporting ATPase
MDAAAILTLVSLGHYLEQKASAQAASSLKALLGLAPQTARRLNAAGREEEIPVADLQPGDRVMLKPGDRVPIDGEIIEGQSSLDESMLTGESLPVEKGPGQKVFTGTINESGTVQLRVTATGTETVLASIIEIVQRAQSSRASIQRLGDRVSSVFVPVVIVIALATALWWGFFPDAAAGVHGFFARFLWHAHAPEPGLGAAVFYAASVLIIACPCAMGLATPVAIMAGANAAARRGILIRDGSALEKSGRITAILFDKTGTLTEGKLAVAEARATEENAALAAALAASSTHPVSKAVAGQALGAPARKFDRWQEVRGAGIEAAEAGGTLRLGRLDWLAEHGARAGDDFAARWEQQGATVVGLARDKELLAQFALKDSPKPHAREILEKLSASGYEIWMVTGDNAATAQAIAGQVGIPQERVLARVRPEGKLQAVEKIRAQGHRVAFVGDGINDAPALQGADLGIALMNASDVAREQADIVLLKSGLEGIVESLSLARAALRTIKQNLFWAFFYNAAGVPLAALGFLSPMFSAFAMGASDLIVVGNALRLKRRGAG